MPDVICDFATVTAPISCGPDLRESLTDVCLHLHGSQTDPLGVRYERFGLLRFSERHGVAIASASGTMLAALRASQLLEQYCAAIASVVTYRVSHLDVARDIECDVPAELQRYYAEFRETGVNLTRKRIAPPSIKSLFSRGPDGRDTGSIMIGNRNTTRVSAILYDREFDAIEKGKPLPGQLLRTELRLGIPGMTLRDIVQPAPLFYEYASPGLCERPLDVPRWEPHGEGYTVERLQRDDYTRLQRLVEHSADLGTMLDLAARLPGDGHDVLLSLIRSRARTRQRTRAFTAAPDAIGGSEQPPAPPTSPGGSQGG